MESKIIIAGDLLPSKTNSYLFEQGKAEELFGNEICNMFRSAAYSIINLEGPLTNSSREQDKVKPVLKASPNAIKGLRSLGVNTVALANNHVIDYLQEGYEETIKILDEAQINHIGAGKNSGDIVKYESIVVGGKKICVYNVSETFFNSPEKDYPGVNIYDEYVVCNEIRSLKSKHDYVIVLYHGGAERCQYPTPLVRRRFHRMADSGADYITAQHTHCIGCEEYYGSSYLLYGQGNFLFDRMGLAMAREGLVTELDFSTEKVLIKHHCVKVLSDGTLSVSDDMWLNGFRERSLEIQNDEMVERRYREYILSNRKLKQDYILAYQGCSFFNKIMKRIMPKSFERKLEKRYTKEQLLRILLSLQSDRTGENVLSMWREVYDGLKK
ncbi:MAG: CapA family protein [Bacteroidales bacterium]|nr:CapA family protein [Bacteroidales bacterium]